MKTLLKVQREETVKVAVAKRVVGKPASPSPAILTDARIMRRVNGGVRADAALNLQAQAGNDVAVAMLKHHLQARLKISSPYDPSEREAEQVAEQIVRMPGPQTEDDRLALPAQALNIHRSVSEVSPSTVARPVEERIIGLRGLGTPLSEGEKRFFESRFGYDFGSVRVHTGEAAGELARSVRARAFTYGRNIVFGPGEYRPGTGEGRRLLAHELTHVIQQGAAASDLSRGEQVAEDGQSRPFLARQTDDTATRPDRNYTPGPGEGQSTERRKEPPPERLYNFSFLGKTYTNLTKLQVLKALRNAYVSIKIRVDSGLEGHKYQKKIRDDQWIVGWISDTVGGVSMPPLSMWNKPRSYLSAANAALTGGNIQAAASNLAKADVEAVKCHKRIYAYREGTISGASITVTGLQVAEVAGAVAATVATGGAASGFWATAAVGSATAGGYSMIQGAAEQTGAMAVGTQKEFDVSKMLKRGAKDAVAGFVGGVVGGALAGKFVKAMGPYLGAAITDAELATMGLTRDAFLTTGQKILPKILGDVGATPLTTAVNIVFARMSGGGPVPKSLDGLLAMVAQDAAKGGLAKLVAESVVESMK